MKKTLIVFAAILVCLALVAALLLACGAALLTSPEDRIYSAFVKRHRPGMENEKVLRQLGSPDYWLDEEGNSQMIPHSERVTIRARLLEQNSGRWTYIFYRNDYPHRLVITFDDQGETVTATIDFIPGG